MTTSSNKETRFLKLTSGEEIVGTFLAESADTIRLYIPLKVDRQEVPGGEYIGFETVVPFQLDEDVSFAKGGVVFAQKVGSILEEMYYTNLYKLRNDVTKIETIKEEVAREKGKLLN